MPILIIVLLRLLRLRLPLPLIHLLVGLLLVGHLRLLGGRGVLFLAGSGET